MAVSTFSKAAAASGAAGAVVPTVVSSTSGTFDLDLSANTAFEIDFTESYFDTLGTSAGAKPSLIGSARQSATNGGAITLSYTSISGTQVGDYVIMAVNVASGSSITSQPSWPSVSSTGGFSWTVLDEGYNDSSGYFMGWKIFGAFVTTGTETNVTVLGNGITTDSTAGTMHVFRGVNSSDPVQISTVLESNNQGLPVPDLTVEDDNSAILYYGLFGGTFSVTSVTDNLGIFADFVQQGVNDNYDTNVSVGLLGSAYASGDTVSQGGSTVFYMPSTVYTSVSYTIAIKPEPVNSGIGPTATIGVSNIPDGVQNYTLYVKNTNSTQQTYPVTNGTNVPAPGFLVEKAYEDRTSTSFSTYGGAVELGAAGGAVALPAATSKHIARASGRGVVNLPTLTAGQKYGVRLMGKNSVVNLLDNRKTYYPDASGWAWFTPTVEETNGKVNSAWWSKEIIQTGGSTYNGVGIDGQVIIPQDDGSFNVGLIEYSSSTSGYYSTYNITQDGVRNRIGINPSGSGTSTYYVALNQRNGQTLSYYVSSNYMIPGDTNDLSAHTGPTLGPTGTQYWGGYGAHLQNGKSLHTFNRGTSGMYCFYLDNSNNWQYSYFGSGITAGTFVNETTDALLNFQLDSTSHQKGTSTNPYTTTFTTPGTLTAAGYNWDREEFGFMSSLDDFYISNDDGATWTQQSAANGFEQYAGALASLGGTIWLAGAPQYGGSVISYDNGANWEPALPGQRLFTNSWTYNSNYYSNFWSDRDMVYGFNRSPDRGTFGTQVLYWMDKNTGYDLYQASDG